MIIREIALNLFDLQWNFEFRQDEVYSFLYLLVGTLLGHAQPSIKRGTILVDNIHSNPIVVHIRMINTAIVSAEMIGAPSRVLNNGFHMTDCEIV